ncbi:MAG: efflux RND transporter permease subunit [Cyanobacteria bacterium J06642_2]
MSLNISEWSIRRPVPTVVLFLVLTLAGLLSFGQLGIDANPNIDIPIVSVTVTQAGAGPEELESQVTKLVEDAVAGLGNIDEISSSIDDGRSTTIINFVLGTDRDRATNDVRNAVSQIRQDLPADIDDPVVQRLQFESGAIMTYAVASPTRSVEELSDLVARTISRALLEVKGVSQIRREGGVDREIEVNLDPAQLQALGITATQINDQLRQLNADLPSGRSDVSGSEQGLRTLGSASTVAAFSQTPIVLPSGRSVPLSELGEVVDGFAEIRQTAALDNRPVVAFSILRSSGSILVSVEEGVRDKIAELERTLPDDLSFQLIFTRADAIRDSYRASIDALILGSILAVVVVAIFLKNWRATLITALALPLSIIPTFAVLQAFGYTLNSMTLLAFTLAVGNLVDDAIVEIENVERHIRMGKHPFRAAIDSTAEVGLAVVTTTATVVAVFIPVAFMGGIPGQFFQPFGVTVAVCTMFSTLVARMMTPMLGAYLLKPQSATGASGAIALTASTSDSDRLIAANGHSTNGHSTNSHSSNGYSHQNGKSQPVISQRRSQPRRFTPYRWLLGLALRNRILTLVLAIVFFMASLSLVPRIPTGLVDGSDTGLSIVSIELPPGSTLAETQRVATRASELLREQPAVVNAFARVGGDNINEAELFVNLKPKGEREQSQQEFERAIRPAFASIPGARVSFFSSQNVGGGSRDLSIVLKSENPDALESAAADLTRQMRQLSGLIEVTSSASLVQPEIIIRPDPQRAADRDVTVRAIANTASLATIGAADANSAKFDLPDRQIPIRVRIATEFRDDITTVENLRVPANDGTLVPLVAVADIEYGSGPASISRFDRSRQVAVEANLQNISLGDAVKAVNELPAMQNLPAEVSQEPSGDAEIMRDIFSRFGLALGAAVVMIYAVLVLLYNNFIFPFSIMMALPLSIGGALLGLLVTQKALGLFALIGVVLLMGLVTKNAILLVDYALIAKQHGKSLFQSVAEAGITRLRPILMTSISTVAGMVPIALELGAGGETRSPMAIAVIGGFTTSTLLTLVIVPVIFTYIDRLQNFLKRLGRGIVNPPADGTLSPSQSRASSERVAP